MADQLVPTAGGAMRRLVDMGDGSWAERVVTGNLSSSAAPLVVGQYKVTAAAVAISSSQVLTKGVLIKARATNAGKVFLGGSGVTVTDDGTGNGFALAPGDQVSIALANVNQLYAIGTANDVIYFVGN